jgi:hypothetical protein
VSEWVAALLILAAFVVVHLIVLGVDRHLARQQARVAEYFRRQVAELARLDELEHTAEPTHDEPVRGL